MKKRILAFVLVLFSVCSLFAAEEYDSDVLLKQYFHEEQLDSFSKQYWDSVKVSLVTLSRGTDLTSWFGHTGICVDFPDGYTSYMFDYGRFSFETQTAFDFFKGYLWYWCGGSSTPSVIEEAKAENRLVTKVQLNLSAEEKRAILNFLETNCDEGLKKFFYKPLTDNCSTRIRDVINRATFGGFKDWAKSHEGVPFRIQVRNTAKNNPLILWFSDTLLGQSTDVKTTVWDEMFLPVNLEKGVLSYSNLAMDYTVINQPEHVEEHLNFIQKLPSVYVYIAVSVILVLISLLLFHWQKAWSLFTFLVVLILTLLGIVIFLGMTFTYHEFFWNNENIILLNPLLILILIFTFKRDKHQTVLKIMYGLFSFASLVLLGLKLVLPSIFFQNNWYQLIVLIPFFFVNSRLLNTLKKTGLDSVEAPAAENSNPLE